ncbi:MAG: hypothetical protein PF489_08700 [Salinivirgaceae bacterium]|jgi:hypothetical protein|nr:hypothetical protein [Salinivirgaceae bacterium]
MENNKNLYEKLQKIVGDKNAKINILQEEVDVKLQVEYFKQAKLAKKSIDKNHDYLIEVEKLYDPEIDNNTKRTLICQLASMENVTYYRALEKFKEHADQELKPWATLALQESRMLLESSLLDEKQLFISTGLGGKGAKLRYFVVLINNFKEEYKASQQEIVSKEFAFSLQKNEGELEEIQFEDKYAMLTCLLPLQKPVQDILSGATKECNTFGDFIKENFLITNVKKMSSTEINEFLNAKEDDINFDIEIDPESDEDNDDFDELNN